MHTHCDPGEWSAEAKAEVAELVKGLCESMGGPAVQENAKELQTENEALMELNEKQNKNNAALTERNGEMQKQLETLNVTVQEMTAKLANAEEENESLKANINQLQIEEELKEKELKQKMADEHTELQNKLTSAEEENESLKANINQLQIDVKEGIEKFTSRGDELEGLKQMMADEHTELQNKLTSAEEENESLKANINQLQIEEELKEKELKQKMADEHTEL
eukprot:TRINITY_DN4136_c0_g2_i2.p1 TRINITY_DN4136_c0_g2~~TRINITY_DN4136_c0_g2_i2.p1  ORF type:complete len:223 (+),score=91.74 TRINITY_DN4136_c0_g2_i2:57-725(+)